MDIFDEKNTLFVEGTDHIIVPCFSQKKIETYSIFPRPGGAQKACRITPAIYVNDKIRTAIIKANIKEVTFEKAKIL